MKTPSAAADPPVSPGDPGAPGSPEHLGSTEEPATLGLAPGSRLFRASLGWGLLWLATPGLLSASGSALLAVIGIAFWGAAVVHPTTTNAAGRPRRWAARWAEYVPAFLGSAGFMLWIRFITVGGLGAIAWAHGLFALLAGWIVRRLDAHFAPWRGAGRTLAIGLAWWSVEILRETGAGFLGLVWMQLGDHAHHHDWLAGGARVFGPEGLTLVLALCGGALASVAIAVRAGRVWNGALAVAGAALVTAALCGAWTSAPEVELGPRVLLVQPGFEQERKQFADPFDNFESGRLLTLDAVAAAEAAGEGIDLVCWGETMLYVPLMEGLEQALADGIQAPAWEESFDLQLVRDYLDLERRTVQARLLERLPEGTSFAAGAEVHAVRGDPPAIRRVNGLVLYDADGVRAPAAGKRHLVPAAETMLGFERYTPVRQLAVATAGYVPGFAPAERTAVLSFETKAGRTYRFGGSICFDNAYMDPFTDAAQEGIDFHLVVSNEAWYRTSYEFDQMLAFSRLAAIATGRTVVRATNSGVSALFDPAGRELDRIRVDGRDRGVRGTLVARVPVPTDPTHRTAYVSWGRRLQLAAAYVLLAVVLLAACYGRLVRKRPSAGGAGPL